MSLPPNFLIGDVDFFFNNASAQPGCKSWHRISIVLKKLLRLNLKEACLNSMCSNFLWTVMLLSVLSPLILIFSYSAYLLVASRCSHTIVTKYWIGALESTNSECEICGVEKKTRTNRIRYLLNWYQENWSRKMNSRKTDRKKFQKCRVLKSLEINF